MMVVFLNLYSTLSEIENHHAVQIYPLDFFPHRNASRVLVARGNNPQQTEPNKLIFPLEKPKNQKII